MSYSIYKIKKIEDICSVASSKRIYASEYVDAGVAFWRSKEVIQKANNEEISDVLYITKERFKEIKMKFGAPIKGDILLASIGANMGTSYYVNIDTDFYFKDGNVTWFNNFSENIYSKYLYFCLNWNIVKANMLNTAIGSAQKALTIESLKKLEIPIPKLDEQKAIAKILSDLDEKIEINNKINKKLEEMAQAIFKQWFVDFEFPNEDGKPYKSSGGEMVESELGMIPKGWKIGTFREFTDTVLGGDWGKEIEQGNYKKEVLCLRGADIPEIKCGKIGAPAKRFILEKNYNNKRLNDGDLVVEISGGSPTQSTGRITYINEGILNRYDLDFVCTNFCRAITLNNKKAMEYFYFYWSYLYDLNVFFQYENGTTGIKNFDVNTLLDKHKIIIPPNY